ncbi:hypothetical protein NDU88_004482 [Pleurodeles waltl]|uniref:Uncharacterized protein n=1 Tax=Pleurodeles waltl TaxID=8319 RepID=A0AAV7T7W9_PLEWA|nr:hypothetical protein NDU88_004482 [Pleurodeles waltl]
MAVGVVTARVRTVLEGVLVMEVLADGGVHAGVSGDVTGREEGDEEEGDTEVVVTVAMSASGCCLCECLWDLWCLCLDELPLGVEVCAGWSDGVDGIGRGTGYWDWVEAVRRGRLETGTMAAISAEARALNDR